jgi:soluble lytic murein transglycosylase-like protein
MSWLERLCLALLPAVVFSLPVRPAQADELIARRLAALKSLVDPAAAREARSREPARDDCPDMAWWRMTTYGERARTEQAIRDASLRYGVDADLVRSVIRVESAYDSTAVSSAGAMGLMQLMPGTARALGVGCPFDPRENVLGGTRYLRELHDRLGSWPRALAAYHAGAARVESGRIPTATRRYVRRVLRFWSPHREVSLDLQ